MPQSLSNVLLHIIFSTKNRANWIVSPIEDQLHRYLATTCDSLKCPALEIGGTQNHIHILCRFSRTITISKLVEKIKTGSSKWIKTKSDRLSKFSWQNGYGAFSVDVSGITALKNYILTQEQHHKHKTFKQEFR